MGGCECIPLPISAEKSSKRKGHVPVQQMAPARQRTDSLKMLRAPCTTRPLDTKQEASLSTYPDNKRFPDTREHLRSTIPRTQYYYPPYNPPHLPRLNAGLTPTNPQPCRNWNYCECQTMPCRYHHSCISCGSNPCAAHCTSGNRGPFPTAYHWPNRR